MSYFSFNCLFNSGIHKGRWHKGQILDLPLFNRDARDFFRKIPDGKTVVYKTVCPYDAVMPDISGQFSSKMFYFPFIIYRVVLKNNYLNAWIGRSNTWWRTSTELINQTEIKYVWSLNSLQLGLVVDSVLLYRVEKSILLP